MISPSPLDTILWFADIEEEIDPIDNVEALFERHKTGPEWDRLNPKDLAGYHAYMVLRDKVREWLDILIKGSTAKKKKVAREIVATIPDASKLARYIGQTGQVLEEFRLIGKPRLAIDSKGNLVISVDPIITGDHAVVLHAMLEIYINKLKIGRCPMCGKYFKRSPKFRVTCSVKCKRDRRIKKVYQSLKKWRMKQRKRLKRQGN